MKRRQFLASAAGLLAVPLVGLPERRTAGPNFTFCNSKGFGGFAIFTEKDQISRVEYFEDDGNLDLYRDRGCEMHPLYYSLSTKTHTYYHADERTEASISLRLADAVTLHIESLMVKVHKFSGLAGAECSCSPPLKYEWHSARPVEYKFNFSPNMFRDFKTFW